MRRSLRLIRSASLAICGSAAIIAYCVLADVEKLLGGELADMTFTDPPYNVNCANSADDQRDRKSRPIKNDALGVLSRDWFTTLVSTF
jgi:DNA modification methylase